MVSSVPPQAISNQRYEPLTGFKWWFRPTSLRYLPERRRGQEGEEEEEEGWHAETSVAQEGTERLLDGAKQNNRNAVNAVRLQSDSPSCKWRSTTTR